MRLQKIELSCAAITASAAEEEAGQRPGRRRCWSSALRLRQSPHRRRGVAPGNLNCRRRSCGRGSLRDDSNYDLLFLLADAVLQLMHLRSCWLEALCRKEKRKKCEKTCCIELVTHAEPHASAVSLLKRAENSAI